MSFESLRRDENVSRLTPPFTVLWLARARARAGFGFGAPTIYLTLALQRLVRDFRENMRYLVCAIAKDLHDIVDALRVLKFDTLTEKLANGC